MHTPQHPPAPARAARPRRRFDHRAHALAAPRRARAADAAPRRDAQLADAGRLAASIAHEVDQPLAAIVLHAHAALRAIERAAAPDEAHAALRAVLDASARAGEIVRSMRALAQTGPAARVRCRLDSAVDEVLAACASDVGALAIDVEIVLARGARTLSAHPVQLRQLLRNLVANAVDALRAVADRPRRLRIAARPDGAGGVVLSVGDNGAGLCGAQAARLFEPLYTTKPAGLGLGLAICRAIAAAHGGGIRAEPGPEHGCVFTCALPAACTEAGHG